jgi:hypothetical protein
MRVWIFSRHEETSKLLEICLCVSLGDNLVVLGPVRMKYSSSLGRPRFPATIYSPFKTISKGRI